MKNPQSSSSAYTVKLSCPYLQGFDVVADSYSITIEPHLSVISPSGDSVEFFHHHSKLPIDDVTSKAMLLGTSRKLTHCGLQPEETHYYWVRVTAGSIKGPLHSLEAATMPLAVSGCREGSGVAAKVKAVIEQSVADGKSMASSLVEPECKKWLCKYSAKQLCAGFSTKEFTVVDDCSITGNLDSAVMKAIDDQRVTPHEEAKAIMDAKKAEIRGEASPLVGGILGESSAFLSAYERPAIVIIDRAGDIESTMEFATAADYKAWKELE